MLPVALSTLGIGGLGLLVAGSVWAFAFPAVENQTGFELVGFLKATRLPTGALLLVAGVVLLYLESQNKPAPRPVITDATLATEDEQAAVDANVRCPFTVNLVGHIAVTSGEGEIGYRFVRQSFNGPEQPTAIRNIRANGAGSLPVRDSYTFNVPVGDLYIEDRLEVLTPENANSTPVKMRVECDAKLPAGPSIPPPTVPSNQEP